MKFEKQSVEAVEPRAGEGSGFVRSYSGRPPQRNGYEARHVPHANEEFITLRAVRQPRGRSRRRAPTGDPAAPPQLMCAPDTRNGPRLVFTIGQGCSLMRPARRARSRRCLFSCTFGTGIVTFAAFQEHPLTFDRRY